MKRVYCVDVHIHNGVITRFYHSVSEGAILRFGTILPGPEHKFIRFPATRQCYLSYLKEYKPYRYATLARSER